MIRVFGAALFACVLAGGQAGAHAIIVDSVPAPLAHVPPGRLAVMLRYNSRIDAGRSKLLLKHGDAVERVPVDSVPSPDVLQATVQVSAGDYELRWQVLATDGHVTRGRVPFTVDQASLSSAPAKQVGVAQVAK